MYSIFAKCWLACSKAAPKVSVVASNDDIADLRARLKAAQRREREAERRAEAAEAQAARAAAAAGRAAAAPVVELQRLRAQLEATAAEADMLRSRLAASERVHSPTRAGRASGSGLAAEMEDVDDAREQQLEAQVH